jgi:hypothetical protein
MAALAGVAGSIGMMVAMRGRLARRRRHGPETHRTTKEQRCNSA